MCRRTLLKKIALTVVVVAALVCCQKPVAEKLRKPALQSVSGSVADFGDEADMTDINMSVALNGLAVRLSESNEMLESKNEALMKVIEELKLTQEQQAQALASLEARLKPKTLTRRGGKR